MNVTRIHKGRKPRLYLREHREALRLSAETVGLRLGIARESVYRLEKRAHSALNPDKALAYADALGIEPEALLLPPGTISLDALVKHQPPEVRAMAVDIVRRLVKK